MQKVAIVTDSIACLPPEVVQQYGIQVVPLNIYFDGRVYKEGVDITPAEAYRLLEKAPNLFATSPGSAGDYLEAYQKVSSRCQSILCITLSSKLSTLYGMASVAKDEAKDKLPGTTIEVLDSLSAAGGEGLIVLAAARAAAEGRNLAEVIKAAGDVRDRVNTIAVLETIRHVYRTGRVPKIAAQLASVINIKPMISVSGKIRITGIARTKERGVRRLLDIMRGKVKKKPVHVAIAHADVPDEGERLKEQVSSEFNCVELYLTDFSPIMGYATGKGTLVIAFYPES